MDFVQQVFYVVKLGAAEAVAGVRTHACCIEGIETYVFDFSF